MRNVLLAVLAVGVMMGVWGCLPEDMPAYTGDGKMVVAVTRYYGMPSLWTYDVGTKTVKKYKWPGNAESDTTIVKCIGGRFWATSLTVRGVAHDAQFDPATGEFATEPEELKNREWAENSQLGSWAGKPCVFVKPDDEKADYYEVYSYPELKKFDVKQMGQPVAAGNNWWVLWHEGAVSIFDAKTREVATIAAKEYEKANEPDHGPRCAWMSHDGKTVLMLVYYGKGGSGAALFNVASGKFIWRDRLRYRITGVPLVKGNEAWVIERDDFEELKTGKTLSNQAATATAPGEIRECLALVRYSVGEKDEAKREVAMFRPLKNEEDEIGQFAPAPDGSHFLVVLNGAEPKLLMIPIKTTVTAAEVTEIRLEVKEAGTRP